MQRQFNGERRFFFINDAETVDYPYAKKNLKANLKPYFPPYTKMTSKWTKMDLNVMPKIIKLLEGT